MSSSNTPTVVVVGAGFGGIFLARQFRKAAVNVILIDRNNYHTFSPLIYQVATAGLNPQDVAYPVRSIFVRDDNIEFLRGEVIAVATDNKQVQVCHNEVAQWVDYDYLVIAAGAQSNDFGNAEVGRFAYSLKTLEDALALRSHIIGLYERGNWDTRDPYHEAATNFVVIGGGPTGLETAGALQELFDNVLRQEYSAFRDNQVNVYLIEATDVLLRPYPERLQASAKQQLEAMGVEVITGHMVTGFSEEGVTLDDGRFIHTYTVVWAAGVKAESLAGQLGVELARGGRIPVEPTLAVTGLDSVYALGDIAYLEDENGQPYAQVIPVAQQQAKRVAKNIMAAMHGDPAETFTYFDKGSMATIGRRRAVAWVFNRLQMTGFLAWAAWLWLHLVTLLGFRNRVMVVINWTWNYLRYYSGGRTLLIEPPDDVPEQIERLKLID